MEIVIVVNLSGERPLSSLVVVGGERELITHPDAQLHILAAVDFQAFVQQPDFLKILPVYDEAANQSRTPAETRSNSAMKVKLTCVVCEKLGCVVLI